MCALTLVLATPRSASAFRTAAQLPKINSSVPVRYEGQTFDYWIVRPSFPSNLAEFKPQDAIIEAARQWALPSCSNARPQFQGLGTDPAAPGDGINSVQWVADWDARGFDPTAAGYTDIQFSREVGGDWSIVEADVYLNANFEWSQDENPVPPLRSLKAVITHEFGHALGLIHPCEIDDEPRCTAADDASVTMYPVYSPAQGDLAPDDIAGICSLYPLPDCTVTGCNEGSVCSAGTCRAECAGSLCQEGELCDGTRCVLPRPCPGQDCIGQPCSKDSQCAMFEHCGSDGHCKQGARLEGEACTIADDCAKGACIESACRSLCSSGGDCPAQRTCQQVDDAADSVGAIGAVSACIPIGSSTGTACTSPYECAGGSCLINAKPTPVCTQTCGAVYPACPVGWACGSAEGRPVCVPVHPTGGCVFAPPSSPSSNRSPEVGGVLFLSVIGLARRRRRRSARSEHAGIPC